MSCAGIIGKPVDDDTVTGSVGNTEEVEGEGTGDDGFHFHETLGCQTAAALVTHLKRDLRAADRRDKLQVCDLSTPVELMFVCYYSGT